MHVQSKELVYNRSLAKILRFKSLGSWGEGWHGCMSVVSILFCEFEVSTSAWSLVKRFATKYFVSNWVFPEASIMKSPRPTRGCCVLCHGKKIMGVCMYVSNMKRFFAYLVGTHFFSFLAQRTYSCSNFVAIFSLVVKLLKKCRVR